MSLSRRRLFALLGSASAAAIVAPLRPPVAAREAFQLRTKTYDLGLYADEVLAAMRDFRLNPTSMIWLGTDEELQTTRALIEEQLT